MCFCFRITAFSQLCSSSLPVLPSFGFFFFYFLSYKLLTTSSFPLLAESGFILELLGHLFSTRTPVHSSVNESGTGSVLAGPTPIADSGKAPEVPQLSKTCCSHASLNASVNFDSKSNQILSAADIAETKAARVYLNFQ